MEHYGGGSQAGDMRWRICFRLEASGLIKAIDKFDTGFDVEIFYAVPM